MSTPSAPHPDLGHMHRPPFPGTENLDPSEIFAGPGYQAPRVRTDPVAVVALVLGLLALVPGLGLLAALIGWWALRRLRTRPGAGSGLAWFGIVVGLALTAWWLWLWLWWMVSQSIS